jgi:hypothetical protein
MLHMPLKSKTMLALALSGQSETVDMPKANAAEPSHLRLNQADIFVPLMARLAKRPLNAH